MLESALVENYVNKASTGTGVATSMLNSAFSTTGDAFEMVRKATEQAIELAKGNFAATAAASKTDQTRSAKP